MDSLHTSKPPPGVTIASLRSKNSTLWARIAGFCSWPARFCSQPEEDELIALNGVKAKSQAVVFLGTTLTKGWVFEANIHEFSPANAMDKLEMKRFVKDSDYRCSIVEAVRRCQFQGIAFKEEIMTLVQSSSTDDYPWIRPDVCSKCGGTELSGTALVCECCENVETHLQCLHKPLTTIPKGKWFCDVCCVSSNLPLGHISKEDESSGKSKASKGWSGSSSNDDGDSDGIGNKRLRVDGDVGTNVKCSKAKPKDKKEKDKIIKVSSIKVATNKAKVNKQSGKSIGGIHISEQVMDVIGNNETENQPSTELPKEEDDRCFVCNEGGKLMLCDFPLCPRAYHYMCVFKTCTSHIDTDSNVDMIQSDDCWFCPKHMCINCNVLEETPAVYNQMFTIPRSMITRVTESLHYNNTTATIGNSCISSSSSSSSNNSYSNPFIYHKVLKSCSSCPFSICKECESFVCSKKSAFKCKRSSVGETICLNCFNSTSKMKLARLLESAWSKMSSSQLALPFIRPLLPGIISSIHADTDDTCMKEHDLLSILDSIRRLKYNSIDEFYSDLLYLKKRVVCMIGADHESIIINAYDTILTDCILFIGNRIAKLDTATTASIDTRSSTDDDAASTRVSCNDSIDTIASDPMDDLTASLDDVMMKLWRKECERVGNTNHQLSVVARSKVDWDRFLSNGVMSTHRGSTEDPWGLGKYSRRRYDTKNHPQDVGTAKEMLNIIYSSEFSNDLDVAKLILGLNSSTKQLPTTPSSVCNYGDGDGDGGDDTLKLYRKLRGLLSESLEVQSQIRDKYHEKRRNILAVDDDAVIRIGEGNILQELQLANNNLTHCLKQLNIRIYSDKVHASKLISSFEDYEGILQDTLDARAAADKKCSAAYSEYSKTLNQYNCLLNSINRNNNTTTNDSTNSSSNDVAADMIC